MIAAVEIHNLYKTYQDITALKGINLTIPQGCFFGLLGRNGAGKSTLINLMAGLSRASAGSISIMGNDVVKAYPLARRQLGVVPQELIYDPFFKVLEFLKIQSGYFGYGRSNDAWIEELLEALGLADKRNADLQTLSGGMKRRVLIAQALVHKPAVVVLDEPTAGVDVELRAVLWDFIQGLHKQGHTIVLTTHYLQEAETLCEEIAILEEGNIIIQESTADLLNHYPYRFLKVTLAEKPTALPEPINALLDSYQDNQIRLRIHKDKDSIGDILELFSHCKVRILDLTTQEPSLEDVFLTMLALRN